MNLNIDGIISLKGQEFAHGRFIWKVVRTPLDICEVARPVLITHDVLIDEINEKQVEIKESFLFEKILCPLEYNLFNQALRTFSGSRWG